MYFDAHNHLQDDRFGGAQEALLDAAVHAGVSRMVVNGACEEDWPAVLELGRGSPVVMPSFGLHPWYVHNRSPNWLSHLCQHLEACPSAVGEIGLDRWMLERPPPWLAANGHSATAMPASLAEQEEVFVVQLRIAVEREVPVSIHCIQAWGRLHELLRAELRPARGFLLHSYGGPVEMIPTLAKLGAYFSYPGYFAHERKHRQRETFRHVPADRLLVETDAPDQLPPDAVNRYPLFDGQTGKPINHPANLPAIYAWLADFLGEGEELLRARVAENFQRLFGR